MRYNYMSRVSLTAINRIREWSIYSVHGTKHSQLDYVIQRNSIVQNVMTTVVVKFFQAWVIKNTEATIPNRKLT